MFVNSFEFILFASIVVFLYYSSKSLSIQNWILLIASFIFYACWGANAIFIFAISLVINYFLSSLIADSKYKKGFLTINIVFNILFLSFFKYANFYVDSINSLGFILNVTSSKSVQNVDAVLLPGISFYTFQMMAYAIDVYKNNYRYCSNFREFAQFVSFFPYILAGPICRASQIIHQIKKRDVINTNEFSSGMILIAVGFLQKVIIADSLAPYVNTIYGNVSAYGGSDILLATYAYSLQIYFDFAGYSTIAIGLGKLFCIFIPQNFNNPYFAVNISDFWHRWNMTLSAWIRDYIYIPLGGNQISKSRTTINLILTMAICGLWHGASWNFVLWGIYHGVLLSLYRLVSNSLELQFKYKYYLNVIGTFFLINIGWIFFRAGSLNDIGLIFTKLLSVDGLNSTFQTFFFLTFLHACVATIYRYMVLNKKCDTRLAIQGYLRLPLFLRVGINVSVFYVVAIFLSGERIGFIYYKF